MHIIVLLERLEKFPCFSTLFVGQGRESFGNIADLAGHYLPTVVLEPCGHGGGGSAISDETCSRLIGGNVVVLIVSEGLNLVGTGFDSGLLEIDTGLFCVCFDKTDMVKEELVAAGGTELGITEKNADFRRRPVRVVGIDLDDHGNLVRRVALEGDVVDDRLLAPDASTLVDGTVNDILGNTFGSCLFKRSKKTGIRRRISASLSGGDGDFPDELTGGLGLLE